MKLVVIATVAIAKKTTIMKNIKLFEEFITENDRMATTPAELKKMAKRFKQDWYNREEGNAEPEELDGDWKFITDYLGTDQIVELIGGDTWANHPNGKALTDRYYELVDSMKNQKDIEIPGSGFDYINGTINGAKVIGQYDGYSNPPYLSMMVNIKDIKKFELGVDPFFKF